MVVVVVVMIIPSDQPAECEGCGGDDCAAGDDGASRGIIVVTGIARGGDEFALLVLVLRGDENGVMTPGGCEDVS